MIFFFGLRTSIIGRYLLQGISCVHCRKLDSVYATIYSRYLHLFWIPILPLGKNSVTECAHCQQVLQPGQMPTAYRIPALDLEKQARTPISNYLVLALAGSAFLLLMLVGSLKNMGKPQSSVPTATTVSTESAAPGPETQAAPDATEALMGDPQVGDFYVVYNPDRHYSVMHLARVVPDSLYFQGCAYRPEQLRDVTIYRDSLLKSRNSFLTPMPRASVQGLRSEGLLTIIRN